MMKSYNTHVKIHPGFLSIVIFLLVAVTSPAQSPGRIGIVKVGNQARFIQEEISSIFYPRGFNYIQLVKAQNGAFGESELFHPNTHDGLAVDDDFQQMAALGYNAVRVFLDLCRDNHCMTDQNGLLPSYIDNIVDLLRRAQQYGLYVMLTMNWLPDGGPYSGPAHSWCESNGNFYGGNCLIMSPEGVARYSLFFRDLVRTLKQRGAPLESIWAYELRNELFVENDQLPFTKTSGMVTTANGKSYNMGSAAEKKKMRDDAVVYWANTLYDVIHAEDPTALVTCGFFTPNEPNVIRDNDPRIVPFEAIRVQSKLDFFDIHAYPGFHDFSLDAENYGIENYRTKPVILGEFGTFIPSAENAYYAAQISDSWQGDACLTGLQGFLYWTWDRHRLPWSEPDDPWGGSDEQAFIGKALSPHYKPDPCKIIIPPVNVSLGKPTKASMEWEGYFSSNVVDGNATETPWIAGSDPPQWVEVDLQSAMNLESIQIVVETGSDDPHFYTHQLQVKPSAGSSYQTLKTFSGNRKNFEILDYRPSNGGLIKNVRFIRVNVLAAPGWAALHELTAFIPQQRNGLDVPPPPILTTPRPGLDTYQGQLLEWKNDMQDLNSEVQIAKDKAFTQMVEESGMLLSNSYQPKNLTAGQIYFWRVQQTNTTGSSAWSVTGMLTDDLTGIPLSDASDISIFPNPAQDCLTIEITGNSYQRIRYEIGILAGNTILSGTLENGKSQLKLPDLTNGMYWIKLMEDQQIYLYRFIVIH